MDFVKAPTICLSMIVKNESHVITRCLESVRPWIQHWCISDTGSTDGTQDAVREALRDVPGHLSEDGWIDFGANRSISLARALASGCDYVLIIDADEVLVVEDVHALTELSADAYRVEMRHGDGLSWPRVNLLKASLAWRYEGIIHEYAVCEPPAAEHFIAGLHMWTDGKGARGLDPEKAQRDLAIMRDALAKDPENARYWFYLGQMYEVAKDITNAINAYAQRAAMGGNTEELWYSLLRRAQLHRLREEDSLAVLYYLHAYNADPTRCEPLYWLATYYTKNGHDELAMAFLERVALLHKPQGAMFVENDVWDSMRWVQYCVVAHNVGDYEGSSEIATRLLASGKCPEAYREIISQLAAPAQAPLPDAVSVGV